MVVSVTSLIVSFQKAKRPRIADLLFVAIELRARSWELLYRNTFNPVSFVKVSEHAGIFCESIGTKYRVPEHHLFVSKNDHSTIIFGMEYYFMDNVTVL